MKMELNKLNKTNKKRTWWSTVPGSSKPWNPAQSPQSSRSIQLPFSLNSPSPLNPLNPISTSLYHSTLKCIGDRWRLWMDLRDWKDWRDWRNWEDWGIGRIRGMCGIGSQCLELPGAWDPQVRFCSLFSLFGFFSSFFIWKWYVVSSKS